MVSTRAVISLGVGVVNLALLYGNAVVLLSANLTPRLHRHIIVGIPLVLIAAVPVYLRLRWQLLVPLLVPAFLTLGSLRDTIVSSHTNFTSFVFAPFLLGYASLAVIVLAVAEFGLRSVLPLPSPWS